MIVKYLLLIIGLLVACVGCSAPPRKVIADHPSVVIQSEEFVPKGRVAAFVATIHFMGKPNRFVLNVSRAYPRRPFEEEDRNPDRAKLVEKEKGVLSILVALNTSDYPLNHYPANIVLRHRRKDDDCRDVASWWIINGKLLRREPLNARFGFLVCTEEESLSLVHSR